MSYTYGTNAFSNNCYLPQKEYWRVNLFQNQECSNIISRWDNAHRGTLVSRCYHKLLRIFHSVNENRALHERKEFSYRCRKALEHDIKAMKDKAPDLIVMYMHAGGQYNPVATEDTKELASFLLEKGVNIVVGTHEHVVHGGDFSKQKETKVATYSLGNFDGIAGGGYGEPFDKMAEYSVAWNVYVVKQEEDVEIKRSTYTILKSIKIDDVENGIKVVPVYHLINETDNEDVKQKALERYVSNSV